MQQPANQSVVAPSRASSSSVNILLADSIDLTMRAKNYDKQPEGEPTTQADSPSMLQSNGPLTFEKPTCEAPSHPSKGTLRHTHNLNVWASQHYNIVEDLAQASCAMSALEVLQSCPALWKSLVNAIGVIDSSYASLLCFDPKNNEPHLPHTIAL